MPLKTSWPIYLDTPSDRFGDAFDFDQEDEFGDGGDVKIFTQVLTQTPEWISPGFRALDLRRQAPVDSFYPKQGRSDCSRALDKSATFTEPNPGTVDRAYDPDHADALGNIRVTNLDPHGPTLDSTSNPLTESDQLSAIGAALTDLQSELDADSSAESLEGPTDSGILSQNVQVAGESYSNPIFGYVFTLFRTASLAVGLSYRAGERFVGKIIYAKRLMQAWLGFLGDGTLTLSLSHDTDEVKVDEMGAYNPTASLDGLPWRMLPAEVGTRKFDAFNIRFVSTTGVAYRITATEFHGGSAGTVHQLTTDPDGNVLQTEALAQTGVHFEIPGSWDESSEPDHDDALVITRVEQWNGEGWVILDTIPVSMDGSTEVAAEMQARLGEFWGYFPLDGSGDDEGPTTVYAQENLVAASTLESSEPACDCGEVATGSANYEAQRSCDPDNGLEIIATPTSSQSPLVLTTRNEGLFGARAFKPFASGAWPVNDTGVEMGDASGPTSQAGTIHRSAASHCDLGDNPFPEPDPSDTASVNLSEGDIVSDSGPVFGGGKRTKFQVIAPESGDYAQRTLEDVRWAIPAD